MTMISDAAAPPRDDRGPSVPGAHEPRNHRDPVRVADRPGLVELAVRELLLVRQLRAQREVERNLQHVTAAICAPRSAERLAAMSSASSEARPGRIGTSRRLYSSASAGPNAGGALTVSSGARAPSGGGRSRRRGARGRSSRCPPASRFVLEQDHDERDAVARPPKMREERPVDAADAKVRPRPAELSRPPWREHPEPDDRGVCDRERERRPERVERADEVDVARQRITRSAPRRRRRRATATAS